MRGRDFLGRRPCARSPLPYLQGEWRRGRFLLLALGAVWGTAAGAEPQSFVQALEEMAQKNPRVISAGYLVRAAEADVAGARSAYRPQLGVTTDFGWSGATTYSPAGVSILPEVRVSQLVFDGGRTPAEIRRRRIRVDLLGVQEQATLADLSLQLAHAWLDYSRQSELVGVSQQQVAALMVLDGLVTEIAGFDRGRASDVVMVESRLQQARTALYSRQIALSEARGRIREVSSLPVEPQGAVPDAGKALPANIDACLALVPASPAARLASLQVDEGQEAERATRNWWAPNLAVEAARTSERTALGDTRLLNGFALRLRASVLPFDSGGGKARHTSSLAALEAARATARGTEVMLRDRVERLWTFQSDRAGRLPELEDLVGRSDQARDIVFEQFRLGRRTILDVLSYDLERFNVRAQLVNERFDIAQTRYQLLGTLGLIYQAASSAEQGA
ncbi:TolC family protein [Novosphingobium flavum]|uniref:TolC family protein n=1 Tax=Novosphingobium flavum TaxID=1778672 RepID=A0A7X1KN37_9SPHN|nr:TolC family protein [Novosphingobium flavum]MBC2667286.1 TolC family protein [Novosphingobium flavum]